MKRTGRFRHGTPEKNGFQWKLHWGSRGRISPLAGSRGRAFCGGQGECPRSSWIFKNFVVFWSFLWQHLQKILREKKSSLLLIIASITHNDYFHLHTLLFTGKHFLQKCSAYLFCERMPMIHFFLKMNTRVINTMKGIQSLKNLTHQQNKSWINLQCKPPPITAYIWLFKQLQHWWSAILVVVDEMDMGRLGLG